MQMRWVGQWGWLDTGDRAGRYIQTGISERNDCAVYLH